MNIGDLFHEQPQPHSRPLFESSDYSGLAHTVMTPKTPSEADRLDELWAMSVRYDVDIT